MFKTVHILSVLTLAFSSVPLTAIYAQTSGTEQLEKEPPELSSISGHLVDKDGKSVTNGGGVYFVFQNRLNEIPHAGSLAKAKAISETSVALDNEGSFTLKLKPGNFAIIYDPKAEKDSLGEPGPESMAVLKKLSSDQVKSKIEAIKENATKGLPISNGKLEDAFVVENFYVRPPVSDFGDIQLQDDGAVKIVAKTENNETIDFPATLRLRGKNGDIMEPHTPSVSNKGEYVFYDILPQSYQVFALGTLPKPGAGDEITTPTIKNDQFIYTGEPLDHEVIVTPMEKKTEESN